MMFSLFGHTQIKKIYICLFQDSNSKSEGFPKEYKFIAYNLYQQGYKDSSFLNKNLKCFYKNSYIAASIIKFKAEELSLEPPVLIFHDAISTSEIEHLKQYGKKHVSL